MSKVSQMIKSTITHSVNGRADDLDLCLFLDFDLAVLGQESKSEFGHYLIIPDQVITLRQVT